MDQFFSLSPYRAFLLFSLVSLLLIILCFVTACSNRCKREARKTNLLYVANRGPHRLRRWCKFDPYVRPQKIEHNLPDPSRMGLAWQQDRIQNTNGCGHIIWIRSLTFRSKWKSDKILKQIDLLPKLFHSNLNTFITYHCEAAHLHLMTVFCSRGSLQDILVDNDVFFTKHLACCLAKDLICGLAYLHHSSVGFHGRLKPTNCLVTATFQLKLADYGLGSLYDLAISNQRRIANPKDRLYMAPELLRGQEFSTSGSTVMHSAIARPADIYAFSILLYQIVHRRGPHDSCRMPSEVDFELTIDTICKTPSTECSPLSRPMTKICTGFQWGCSNSVHDLLEDCCREQASDRPDVDHVYSRLSTILHFSSLGCNRVAVQNENLNEEAECGDERLKLLLEDKNRKLHLLSTLVPRFAIDNLARGLSVRPRTYKSATLLFSSISNYQNTSLCPHEHIKMLDDLNNLFDSVVLTYKVHKVETVQDTYLAASGLLPEEYDHTTEIAQLALHLLKTMQSTSFQVYPIRLRLGIHTGPIAAGFIGLDRPRCCLFGDTVNVASRLSTTGEDFRIQISSECFEVLSTRGSFVCEERGVVEMKGKGLMTTYWLLERTPSRCRKSFSHPAVQIIKPAEQ